MFSKKESSPRFSELADSVSLLGRAYNALEYKINWLYNDYTAIHAKAHDETSKALDEKLSSIRDEIRSLSDRIEKARREAREDHSLVSSYLADLEKRVRDEGRFKPYAVITRDRVGNEIRYFYATPQEAYDSAICMSGELEYFEKGLGKIRRQPAATFEQDALAGILHFLSSSTFEQDAFAEKF